MNIKLLRTIFCIGLLSVNINATSLRDTVEKTINTNPDIIAEHFNKKAFKTNIDEQQRDYYPTLDFSGYVEESETKYNLDDDSKQDGKKNGWNATLKFEQVLYDGGLTPNEIEEFKHRYYNIKYTSKEKVEALILEIVNTYTKLVLSQELIALDNFKIKIHENYLVLAKEKEEISGEILDWYQVSSKIKAIMDNYLEQEVKQQRTLSTYKKLTGSELEGNICRPILDEKLIPQTVEEAIEIALRKNNTIRAQHELIREQKSRMNAEQAKFRPDLKLQVEGDWDNDIAEAENGQRDIYRVRVQSDWNLYNGGKDTVSTQREKILILKEKKILDAIKNNVIDEIKGSYNTYFKIKKKIKNLKAFNLDNKAIVDIYNQQLEDGSRTFLDLLNAEAELFRTKVLQKETEFLLYDEYYNLLKSLDMLSDSILTQNNQECVKYSFNDSMLVLKKDENQSEDDLASELGLD